MQWRQDPDSQAQRPADAIAHRAVGWVGTGDVPHPVAWMSSSVIRVGGEPVARHTGLEQPTTRRVSLAVGSAPLVYRRGIKLAGCRCAPRPPYSAKVLPNLGQIAIRRVSLAVGSAPWFIGATQSWRVVAALRSRPTVRRYRRIWGKSRPVGCHSP